MIRFFQSSSKCAPVIGKGGVLLATALLLGACGSPSSQNSNSGHQHADQAAVSPTPRIPAFISNLAEAGPLPKALDPRQFSDPPVVKAYTYAGQNPEIFAQQPCYCYCDTGEGHRGLLDCFATTHGAT